MLEVVLYLLDWKQCPTGQHNDTEKGYKNERVQDYNEGMASGITDDRNICVILQRND